MIKNIGVLFALILLLTACGSSKQTGVQNLKENNTLEYALVIHGGAGNITQVNVNSERAKLYKAALQSALLHGQKLLKEGSAAEEVVVETIKILEDSPLFNAGRGSVYTHDETIEMDASIMTGKDQNAGAVAGVQTIKNPITAAYAVMKQSPHFFMSGDGAEQFAEEHQLKLVDPNYFKTERRLESLKRVKRKASQGSMNQLDMDSKYGTVGCVVLDKNGNIAAGTSTGGMTNKRYNRIGDSPVIGAGTYADNATCGISSTGHGEYFIRYAVAHDISSRMAYLGENIQLAARTVIQDKLKAKGGTGGVIGLDRKGNITMEFNTAGMFRGYITPTKQYVGMYKND